MTVNIKEKNMLDLAEYRRSLWKKPTLQHLFFELTDQCNLHCRHCGSSCTAAGSKYLSVEVIEKTLKSVASHYSSHTILVNLTGGEPMLHPNFFDIISMAHRKGFGVGMTSNGTLIKTISAKKLAESGLDTIAISLDGIGDVHEKFRNVSGCYSSAIMGIYSLKQAGIEPEVLTVVHRDNFFQLEKMYELLRKMDIYSWRVVNIEPIGRALSEKGLLLDRIQMKQLLDFIREKRFDNSNPMEVSYGCSHFVTFEYERMIRDFYFQCGAGTTVGSVLANGDIVGCLDIERRAELIQGNAYSDDFTDVWENRFQTFRFDRSDQCVLCHSCRYKPVCMGDSMHTWDFAKKEPLYCVTKLEKENDNEF